MCEGVGVYHVSTKTPDRNDLKRSTVVVFDTVSKPIDFGSNGQGSRAQGPLTCVFTDCRRTRDEETLPLPIHIRRRRSTSEPMCISQECTYLSVTVKLMLIECDKMRRDATRRAHL